MIIVFLQIKPAKYGFFKKSEITIFLNIQLACMAGRIVSGSKVLVEVLQRHAENDTLPLLDMAALPSKLSHVQKQIHHLHWLNIQFKKNSIEIKVVMWLNIPPPPLHLRTLHQRSCCIYTMSNLVSHHGTGCKSCLPNYTFRKFD